MKKMPCLFVRKFIGYGGAEITQEVTPGCEWVALGGGTASRKWDGTACAVIWGVLHKRYDAKRGKDGNYKPRPANAIACCDPDPVTGHWPHWVPVACDNPGDKHHVLAWALFRESMVDGTYELVGPPIGGNADGAPSLEFKKHGDVVLDVPRDFSGLRQYLTEHQIEGVVFAHPDGRMCKIRRADFGLPWGASQGK